MSTKVLLRIALALVVLVFAWGALAILRRPGSEGARGLTLPRLTAGELTRVALHATGDSTVLERRGESWRVNGLPASAQAVAGFLAALNDSAAQSELVAESAQSHERLAVDTAHGRRLTLSTGSGVALDLWLGRRGPEFEGFYAREAGAEQVYLLRGAFAEATAMTVEQWRDRQVARLGSDSIGRITVQRGRESWTLARGGASGWMLRSGPADSARAGRFVFQFGDVRAAGFPDARGPTPDLTRPERQVAVLDRAGQPLLRLVLDSTDGGAFWARRESDGVVFRLDARVVDLVAPAEATLRP
jgi:hypothetical protein